MAYVIGLLGYKGGVGKTTTAIHLAAALLKRGEVQVVDGDSNGSARLWAQGGNLPFPVRSLLQFRGADDGFVVVDSAARPSTAELTDLAEFCDLLIVPSNPEGMSLDALQQTVNRLEDLKIKHYCALLTMIPPAPSKKGVEARNYLIENHIPLFDTGIRRTDAFLDASTQGSLVYEVKGSRAAKVAWLDFEALGTEVLAFLDTSPRRKS
jgi:chromosome partitioning protein